MTAWGDAMTTLEGLLDTARSDVNAALGTGVSHFEETRRGEPSNITLFKGVAYWYEGFQESETGGNSLAKVNIQEKVTVRWYIPVISRDAAFSERQEDQLQACNLATLIRLFGSVHLGQPTFVIGMSIINSTAAWQNVNDAWTRVLTIPVLLDCAWVADIT